MLFSDLYAHADIQPGPSISVRALADHVSAHHEEIGEVNFFPVELDPDISLGHMLYEMDRDSAYGEEFRVANIRYSKDLNRCWRRFVCCKELMHTFDDEEQRANTREKFLQLMSELEQTPAPGGQVSAMFQSETNAVWMAGLVLCPRSIRAQYVDRWRAKELTDYDVALSLRIPEIYVGMLMGRTYDYAFNILVEQERAQAAQ